MSDILTPDSGITIRRAQHPDDLDHMQKMLGYAAGGDTSDPLLPNYYSVLEDGLFDGVIAEAPDQQPMGAAWFSYFTDDRPGNAQYGGYPEITIAVEPDYRRKMVGRTLMNSLVSLANEKGVEGLALDVLVGNLKAENLYRSLGFKPCKQAFGGYQTMVLLLT